MSAATALAPQPSTTGFSFDNCQRNAALESSGATLPKAVKTGTTICGIVYKDGVILGADTRATDGSTVASLNCQKIHYLSPNMYCCGAGTAADTEQTTKLISSNLELHALNTGRQAPLSTALKMLAQMLFKYQGHISAALVLGGVDRLGPHIYSVHPHGSVDRLPYVTMGSGSLAAMAVFESRFRPDMELEEGKKLVRDAITSGIFNDLGSGTNVDLCVITKDGAQMLRPYDVANVKGARQERYRFKRGTTAVLKTRLRKFDVQEESVTMDTSEASGSA